jgi:hypothetical protein
VVKDSFLCGFREGFHAWRDLQADYTKDRIKEYYITHPGASVKDAAYELGLSASTIGHYRLEIRKDWLK